MDQNAIDGCARAVPLELMQVCPALIQYVDSCYQQTATAATPRKIRRHGTVSFTTVSGVVEVDLRLQDSALARSRLSACIPQHK